MNTKRLVITGGHAATMAISVVEELIRRGKNSVFQKIFWIGSPKAMEGTDVPTTESVALPKLGVKYIPITAGRLQIKYSKWTVISLFKIPLGFIDAFRVLRKIKPHMILSFGGFSAFPVVVVGKLFGVPVILHEQTSVVGRVNRYTSPLATKIALARKSSERYFPPKKCVLVGNPIMTQVTEVPIKEKIEGRPTIYVTGGSRGSVQLNTKVGEVLESLLEKYFVLHNTGRLDYSKFVGIKGRLPEYLKSRYEVYPFIDPLKVDNAFRQADIIVSRSGASIVSEIMVVKRPAVLVPIPWSYLDEQTKNAEYAERCGLAKIIKQKDLTGKGLLSEIEYLIGNYTDIVARAKSVSSQDLLASKRLVDLLEETV